MNKIILELELPTEVSDKNETSVFLSNQISFAIKTLRDVLNSYKEQGVLIPTLSIRSPIPKVIESNTELKQFRISLIDHLLQFQPKIDVPGQMRVIKELFAIGKPIEYWIEMFEDIRKEYPLVTWFTVKHRITKQNSNKQEESQFTRKEMDEKGIEEIQERLKQYKND